MAQNNQYIIDTRYASRTLIEGCFKEHGELETLTGELRKAELELASLYRHVEFSNLNPDLDDDGIGTSARWEAHFDVEPKVDTLQEQVTRLQKSVADKHFSAGVLAGGLLQIAKQGISDAYSGLGNCPLGRNVGGQSLKTVIWQARNQSMHYEEGQLNAAVINCFMQLARDFGPHFGDPLARNLAFDVVAALGWSDPEQFESDMASLLP